MPDPGKRDAPTDEGSPMPKKIDCDCGTTVRGVDDDQLVANAEDHMRAAHPDMEPFTREQLLAMAKED